MESRYVTRRLTVTQYNIYLSAVWKDSRNGFEFIWNSLRFFSSFFLFFVPYCVKSDPFFLFLVRLLTCLTFVRCELVSGFTARAAGHVEMFAIPAMMMYIMNTTFCNSNTSNDSSLWENSSNAAKSLSFECKESYIPTGIFVDTTTYYIVSVC